MKNETALESISKLASALVKEDESLTSAQAIAKAVETEEGEKLYRAYLSARGKK